MVLKRSLALLLLTLAVGLAIPAQAEIKTERVAGVDYNIGHTLAQNLTSLTGKQVTLHLVSGDTLAGKVKAVNDQMLHLEKLERKEFFDALILIRDISAIETRFLKPVR